MSKLSKIATSKEKNIEIGQVLESRKTDNTTEILLPIYVFTDGSYLVLYSNNYDDPSGGGNHSTIAAKIKLDLNTINATNKRLNLKAGKSNIQGRIWRADVHKEPNVLLDIFHILYQNRERRVGVTQAIVDSTVKTLIEEEPTWLQEINNYISNKSRSIRNVESYFELALFANKKHFNK